MLVDATALPTALNPVPVSRHTVSGYGQHASRAAAASAAGASEQQRITGNRRLVSKQDRGRCCCWCDDALSAVSRFCCASSTRATVECCLNDNVLTKNVSMTLKLQTVKIGLKSSVSDRYVRRLLKVFSIADLKEYTALAEYVSRLNS
jgi:hypothetical protein